MIHQWLPIHKRGQLGLLERATKLEVHLPGNDPWARVLLLSGTRVQIIFSSLVDCYRPVAFLAMLVLV